jgi:two-component system, OmpR family, phosphate regulon sensor histidine kinase PhoR
MAWWLTRTLAAVLAVTAGASLGALLGQFVDHPLPAMFGGGLITMAVLVARDSWRGQRVIDWLRGPMVAPAPRQAAFWDELGYRIEKVVRTRELQTRDERDRIAHFLSAIEASPNGVLMLDSGDQIEWCNSVAAEHFGLDPLRDRRLRVTNLVRMPAFVAHLQVGRFGDSVTFAGPLGRSTLSVIVRPYGDGKKLVLSQDITEHERADAMRRDFVANVSHEIRSPLTALAGFVESLTQLPLTDAERGRVLALMQQQTDRMRALVGDLLTLARIEGSPRPAADRWIGVAALIEQATVEARALSAGRHLLEAVGGDDAEIAGNQSELYSALTNLVNNAVRFTPDGGKVQIRWQWRANGGGELAVSDTGIGIAREHLPRLTERFYRVDSSRSRDTGGTGLGLSIVKHVAQRHGGEIEAESEPGKGSCFRLVFPAFRLRPEAAPQPPRDNVLAEP